MAFQGAVHACFKITVTMLLFRLKIKLNMGSSDVWLYPSSVLVHALFPTCCPVVPCLSAGCLEAVMLGVFLQGRS